MVVPSLKLPVFLAATAFVVAPMTEALASGACTVKTARQSAGSPGVLCECDSVTSGMLRYIQRRADFDQIVARLGAECSPLADLLTDLPTASTGSSDSRSGDGPSQEGDTGGTPGGTNNPGGNSAPDGNDSPRGGDPDQGEPEREEPDRGEPERDEPDRGEPEREEPDQEEPEREEPDQEEPEREEPDQEEPEREEPDQEEPEREEPEELR